MTAPVQENSQQKKIYVFLRYPETRNQWSLLAWRGQLSLSLSAKSILTPLTKFTTQQESLCL